MHHAFCITFGVTMYKINPNSYASAFVLPTDVADKHLRMAGKAQLKVLLWLYRNPLTSWDMTAISRDTGVPADEIDDAMLYWIDAGLVLKDGENPAASVGAVSAAETVRAQLAAEQKNETQEKPQEQERKEKPSKPVLVKPSIKDIARRINESEQVRSMFSEVQEVFGRTLGYDVQSSLLILHDHYSLPAEVVVMICNYSKTVGKQGSLAYIMKVGAEWADLGIDSFEKASAKIARLESANNLWTDFKQVTGVENPKPTSKQLQFLEIWVNDYGFNTDMIALAYEKAVEKKGSINFSYMNGILKSWHESGHKSVDDVFAAEVRFAGESEKKRTAAKSKPIENRSAPSYDIELAVKRSLALDPTKTKKGQ